MDSATNLNSWSNPSSTAESSTAKNNGWEGYYEFKGGGSATARRFEHIILVSALPHFFRGNFNETMILNVNKRHHICANPRVNQALLVRKLAYHRSFQMNYYFREIVMAMSNNGNFYDIAIGTGAFLQGCKYLSEWMQKCEIFLLTAQLKGLTDTPC